ncbi:MAG: hypothetical protein ACOY45_14170 [Pseudomonadota bacterium]
MPQAIGVWLLSVGISGLAATLITTAVTIGLTIGANMLFAAVFGPSRPKPSDGQQNVRGSVGSRKRHYGIVHTGGQETFFESRNGTLATVVTLGTGEESEILEHRINDKVVTVDGTGKVTDASFHGAVYIHTRPGSPDQTAIGELTAKFPEWTPAHRQRGCAHAVVLAGPVKQEHYSEAYNNQRPQYTQVRKAVKIYDPRLDSTAIVGFADGAPVYGAGAHRLDDRTTWSWSDNWALLTADYFAHEDGYGGGFGNVNWTNIAQEADRCDETVEAVNGDIIARWRIWASYGLADEERRAVLTDMLSAGDGFCWQDADGKFNLMSGRWEAPDITITDDHILRMTPTLGPSATRRVSAIKVLYTEAAIGYREQESALVGSIGDDDDPNTDVQAVRAYYVPHHNQAVRLGKIMLGALDEERWHIPAILNLYGLNLLGRRFVRLTSARAGIDCWMKIDGLRLLLAEDPPKVEAQLSEVRPEDWSFDAATEEGAPPIGDVGTPTSVIVPAPTGLALSAIQIALGETNGVAIGASWADPGRPDLIWEAQYSIEDAEQWVAMAVNQDERAARSGPVDSGETYDGRVRARTISGRPSEWTYAKITPTADATPLAAPTILDVDGGVGEADISIRLPTTPTLAYARLYGAATADFGTAVQVGADIVGALGEVVTVHEAGLASGARYYWARAFDGAGGQSVLFGPAIATIS